MSEPILAPFGSQHIAAAARIDAELFGPDAWPEAMFRDELAQGRDRYYLAVLCQEELAGFAGLALAGPEASVHTIDVAPAYQRRGIGTMLLRSLLEEAARRGAGTVLLEVSTDNAVARRLYERHGFRAGRVRRHYYPGSGKDAVEMQRSLGGLSEVHG